MAVAGVLYACIVIKNIANIANTDAIKVSF